MAYTREQKQVASILYAVGRRKGANRRELLAALATGLVESGLRNLRHGDGSSIGWRQETASSYPNANRLNVHAGAGRFFDETRKVRNKYGGNIGALAQAVQRSAFPGRYNQQLGQAKDLLRWLEKTHGKAGGGGGGGGGGVITQATKQFDQAGFEQARKKAIVGQLLSKRRGTDSILFKSGLLTTEAPDPSQFQSIVTKKVPQAGGGGGGSGGRGLHIKSRDAGNSVARMIRLADAFDRKGKAYLWGGGHGGIAKPGDRVDCSGFVSAVLGVSPRTSGGFKNYGRPGRGKHVTLWTNDGHILIQIGKRWYATSKQNPGGGAGRIKTPSRAYLSSFIARHPKGL